MWRCAWFEPLNDDHAAAAAGAEICRLRLGLGSIGADCLDGIDGNDWRHEQFAGAGDVLGAVAAGEQAIVADAVEARGQHVHEKALLPTTAMKAAKMTNDIEEETKAVPEEEKWSNVGSLQDDELDLVTGGVRTYGPIMN